MGNEKTESTVKEAEKIVSKFSKEKILKAEKYKGRTDLVGALLKDGKEYSIEEVDAMIEKFKKGKVN